MRIYFIICFSAFFCAHSANAFEWQKISKSNTRAIQSQILALDNFFRSEQEKSLGVFTDSVLVIHKDKIIYERNYNDYHENSRHQIWSISKSITSAILGIVLNEGKIHLNDSLCFYLTRVNSEEETRHCNITIKNVLEFSTGFAWRETYGSFDPSKSSVINMLYGDGSKDVATFVFSQALETDAGKKWTYSTGDTMLLWGALKNIFSKEEYEELPWRTLFTPLGMKNVTFEQDASGTYLGGSYIYTSPRDLARVGRLFLNQGNWDGVEVLPKSWIDYVTTVAPAYIENPVREGKLKNVGAAHWWVNKAVPEQNVTKPWPSGPDDTFAALGVFGQTMFIVPSKNLIAIRLGHDIANQFDRDKFLKQAIALTEEK